MGGRGGDTKAVHDCVRVFQHVKVLRADLAWQNCINEKIQLHWATDRRWCRIITGAVHYFPLLWPALIHQKVVARVISMIASLSTFRSGLAVSFPNAFQVHGCTPAWSRAFQSAQAAVQVATPTTRLLLKQQGYHFLH